MALPKLFNNRGLIAATNRRNIRQKNMQNSINSNGALKTLLPIQIASIMNALAHLGHEPGQETETKCPVQQAIQGKKWTQETIDSISYEEALSIAVAEYFDYLPEWARSEVIKILMELLDHPETTEWTFQIRANLPTEFLAAAKNAIPKEQFMNLTREAAYRAWQAAKHDAYPTKHPESVFVIQRFQITPASLAAFYAHFGRVAA